MNIYVCNTPIGFPQSEYGGMVAVMAKNPKELGKILTEKYDTKLNAGYFDLSISVKSAIGVALDQTRNYPSGILMEFIT